MTLDIELNKYYSIIDDEIKKVLEIDELKDMKTLKAMKYSLLAGGKRFRPILSLACCDALGGDIKEALPFAVSLEMIHTYSLIHDDLPCMDDDDLRRGKPTNHKVYGENFAVLAGDGLLNFAYENAINAKVSDDKKVKIISVLSKNAGIFGMIGGQNDDVEAEEEKECDLYKIHERKTGALIQAACAIGAIAANGEADAFYEYAKSLGLAFQIRDDILDFEGTEEVLGKPVMSDAKNSKATFVTMFGMEKAKEELIKEKNRAISALDKFGERSEFLREFTKALLS